MKFIIGGDLPKSTDLTVFYMRRANSEEIRLNAMIF